MFESGVCPHCKTANPQGARFCNGCGKPIKIEENSTQSTNKDPLIGTLVGKRFVVLEKIGEGGMGVVYRAEQVGVGRQVALKVLNREYALDKRLHERFRNEAAIAARFNHPNSVTVYDFGITDGHMYIAMELVDGLSLSDVQKNSPKLEWKRACRIILQVASCLKEAHDSGIIHRDIKPDNIMLINRGDVKDIVKVLDFGIAKIIDDKMNLPGKALTMAGEIFGTPAFISPEQILGNELDSRSDLYSLGVVFYNLLTGKLPFTAQNPMGLLTQHLHDQPPSFNIMDENCNVPKQLEQLVLLTLEKKPERRPAGMKDFASDIASVYGITSRNPKMITEQFETFAFMEKQKASLPPGSPFDERTSLGIPIDVEMPEPQNDVQKQEESLDKSEKNIPAEINKSQKTVTNIEEETDNPLQSLVKAIKRSKEFPAVSAHISDLNRKASCSTTSATGLANVILKDFSLTSKLLNMINSAYYAQVKGRVKTISRAVVLMGFEQVRQAAMGLMMFDQFASDSSEQAGDLQEEIVKSIMTGLIAKKSSAEYKDINSEEAFIASMFHNLGKNVTIMCLDEKWKAIKESAKVLQQNNSGLTETSAIEKASRNILKVSFEELGIGVAREWGFPEDIIATMQSLPEGHIKKTGKAGERLNHIVGFTSELGDIISEGSLTGSSEQNKLKIKDLLNRYSSTIIFTEDEIDTLLKNVLEEIDNYTSMFNISTTNVSIIDKLTISTGGTVKPRQHIQKTPSKKILSPKAEARRLARKKQAEHEMILLNGVEDVAQAVIRHDSVETVIMMMLETMYRGLNLSHVLACMKTGDDGLMTASSGFGEDIEEYTRRFRFYVDRRKKDQNLFTMSLLQSRDFVVNTEKERSKTLMFPEWYQGLEKPKWIFIYPLLIDGHPEGLFYGDIMQEDATIDRDLLKHIHPLRAHVAKAIRRSNQSRH